MSQRAAVVAHWVACAAILGSLFYGTSCKP